ncbi:translocon-associated protein subunit gamma-like [Hydractinia symbiolongicarpus]|uniref:translocon-associated protein subunit gamma-like n=1 Tax=Hydractinia symbiolongicarpus TaxID=13093 RepID=UPI00254D03F0|nr:translocon-associated protein subunit gamma-like [Hydractinia symbiolongicarpus]
MPGKGKLTQEEEVLLQDFSRTVSKKSQALFYGNALMVAVLPLWLFWKVHLMDPMTYAVLFVVGTLASSYLVAFAYKNTKFTLKHKIAQKRESVIAQEVNAELDSKTETKKLSRKEKDDRILWKKNNVADTEATTFAIFYSNALYLFIIIMASFYFLRSATPAVNFTLSTGMAAGLVALFSTGSQ